MLLWLAELMSTAVCACLCVCVCVCEREKESFKFTVSLVECVFICKRASCVVFFEQTLHLNAPQAFSRQKKKTRSPPLELITLHHPSHRHQSFKLPFPHLLSPNSLPSSSCVTLGSYPPSILTAHMRGKNKN